MKKTLITKKVTISDDLDGSADAAEVSFGYEGSSYLIDLTESNRFQLEEALAPYVRVARRGSRRRAYGVVDATGGVDRSTLRAWAEANEFRVGERGRISKNLLTAYQAAH